MKTIHTTIGSFEAKTHLSGLIDNVQKGHEYIITKRGKPVAKLVPYVDPSDGMDTAEIMEEFHKLRNSVKGRVNIKEYIAHGRK